MKAGSTNKCLTLVVPLLALALGGPMVLHADTLHVPADYATIQAAIDAATHGDEVVIADGTYTGTGNKNLGFAGKAITVRSASGNPALCIIDCEGAGRGFYFHSGEGADSVVEGLTITNGYVDDGVGGAGVFCYASSPTLTNCIITGNTADGSASGGGVQCRNSSSSITNCTISGNFAAHGGGVYCRDASPMITNCTIIGNTGGGTAGGVGISYGGSPTLTNCTFTGNTAFYGCGMRGTDGSPTLTNCVFWGDISPVNFPELDFTSGCDAVVTYCNVEGGYTGTGNIDADPLFAFSDDLHLLSGSPCIDTGTDTPPGGLPAEDSDGNPRPLDGDGDTVAVTDMGAYEFNLAASSIALSPVELDFDAIYGQGNPSDQTLGVRNCGGGTLSWEITGQPAWLTVQPSSGDSNGEVDEVTLSVDVSGLDIGRYTALLEVADPQAGNSPREVLVTLDVVCRLLHVPSEYATIQAAIDAALDYDEIIVADGTYTGDGNRDLTFDGKAITLRSESGNPEACIIDCQGSAEAPHRGFYFFYTDETLTSVVDGFTITNGYATSDIYAVGGAFFFLDSSATITNCIMTNCHAESGGGALYWYDSRGTPFPPGELRLLVENCTITMNRTGEQGGGMCLRENRTNYNPDFEPAARITNCTITGNETIDSSGYGGGMIVRGYIDVSNCTIAENQAVDGGGIALEDGFPTFIDCVIRDNTAEMGGGQGGAGGVPTYVNCTITGNQATADYGGGLSIWGAHGYAIPALLVNCTISKNTAADWGGGLQVVNSDVVAVNCELYDNTAGEAWDGGGVTTEAGDLQLINCTLSDNTAGRGAGLSCQSSGAPSTVGIVNCIFWGNNDDEIANLDGSTVTVAYSDICGGWAGTGNIDQDPFFTDPGNDDYHLGSGSPCVDASDPAFMPEPDQTTDMDGQYRLWDGNGDGVAIVDMGADEFGSYVAGDVNCSDQVNNFDISAFLLALLHPEDYAAAYPDCSLVLADINGDGSVDNFDISPFVDLLLGH
ncbi:MAG: right-handed parallel beta-helix repeat-containing protein [Phycisphaerae bacterium]|jgi:hypothetical protein